MNGASAGGASFLLNTLLELILAIGGAYVYIRWQRLRRQHDRLVQEKEVIFGFVHDVGEVFAETEHIEPDLLLKRVLFYAMRTTKGEAGAVYLYEGNSDQLRARALSGIFPPLTDAVRGGMDTAASKSRHIEHLVKTRLIRRGEGLIGQTADLATPVLIPFARGDTRVPNHEVDFLQIQTVLAVPMRFHQNILGVLVLVNRTDGLPFTQTDLNLLQALADQASASIHYAGLRDTITEKKRIDRDLGVARQIQHSLLPKEIPHLPGVEIAAFNDPAEMIGGDYYDVVAIDDQHLGIAVADVSGKGIGGALMMSVCRSVLRAQAPMSLSPAVVLRAINRVMSQDISPDMFVTMIYMVLHTDSHELVVARAGHERPILMSPEGEVRFIDSEGVAIGLITADIFDQSLTETTVKLNPGDVVTVYTDGITEAMNTQHEEWGVPRFLDTIKVAAPEGANSVINHVRQRLQRFVSTHPQYDDMTLLALREIA